MNASQQMELNTLWWQEPTFPRITHQKLDAHLKKCYGGGFLQVVDIEPNVPHGPSQL